MKLNVTKRVKEKATDAHIARRTGKIPGVIYSRGKEGNMVYLQDADFAAILRTVPKGMLSTQVVTLVDDKGAEKRALVKEIQYHPTTYQVLHVDFIELHDKTAVNVRVPVEMTGVADCAGVKQGGILRQVIRTVRVKCWPDAIPSSFSIDVKDLGIMQVKRLSDIAVPQGVKPLEDMKHVAVVVAKR